ncbi:MAG: hypothetical protein LBV79_11970 [Candidatus Adiutrix sp.]|jgi:hypothetical protein|nr:hypothetical protein [Candidatus Adiutrix sp.]
MSSKKENPIAVEERTQVLERIAAKLLNSRETGDFHGYLLHHDVPNYDLTADKDGNLLGVGVDLEAAFTGAGYRPKAQTLLTIPREGKARLEPGAETSGAALMIGHREWRKIAKIAQDACGDIYIARDYPTGAAVHRLTGRPTAVAFLDSNLKTAGQILRRKFPRAEIILYINSGGGRRIGNLLERAWSAAQAAHGLVIVDNPRKHKTGLMTLRPSILFLDDAPLWPPDKKTGRAQAAPDPAGHESLDDPDELDGIDCPPWPGTEAA